MGLSPQHGLKRLAAYPEHLAVRHGAHRCGPRRLVEQRHLAEYFAALPHGDDDVLHVGLLDDLELALHDHIGRVARLRPPRSGSCRRARSINSVCCARALQVLVGQAREQIQAAEEVPVHSELR